MGCVDAMGVILGEGCSLIDVRLQGGGVQGEG